MYLECTCADININKWEKLMKDAKPFSYKKLLKLIKINIPYLYEALCLNLSNPFAEQTQQTKTHYILVHSAIEYFINKGE